MVLELTGRVESTGSMHSHSYNLILIAISLRLIKMSINRPGCGLKENYDFREINAFLSKIIP